MHTYVYRRTLEYGENQRIYSFGSFQADNTSNP